VKHDEDDSNLVPISIRLDADLIDDLKAVARLRQMSYQTMMREALNEWVTVTKRDFLAFRDNEQNTRELPDD